MYSKLKSLCICFLFGYTFSVGYAADVNQQSASEIQVLIDVSGSMKKNDPKNLRISAVKLLVNLLPDGTKAGIWLFAEKTKVLVETGIVNPQWKNNALAKIGKIHSSGLFTNIEDAIQASTQGWVELPGQQKRNLILLTDGMVDVSKDIMQSAESRERIMAEQILQLQQAGVHVQAIALSENADAELLDKLAFDTNGWLETAQSASQLQKVFFKMFKKAIPQDTVPITGNEFKLDTSVKEFSVLIFKKVGAPATQLHAPGNTKVSSADHPDNVAWLEEKNYDLVSIKNPKAGVWKIDAEMDPDNQVMIVTDLQFQVDELPNHVFGNEAFEVTAFFTDKYQLISREDFLSLIDISILHTNAQGVKSDWKMQPVSGKAGLFSQTIGKTLGKGKHTIKIIADGKTFQRESVKTFEVVQSLVTIETLVNKTASTVSLKLTADETILNTELMTVQAIISQKNLENETRFLEKSNGAWVLEVTVPVQGSSKIINFSINAKTLQGSSVSPNVKAITINESMFSKTVIDSVILNPDSEKRVENIDATKDEAETEAKESIEESAEKNNEVNWMKTSVIVIAINVFFIIAGFFMFKFMRKKRVKKQALMLDRLA
ncbi:MAG: VWA domain-containing protein [Methylococcaceae bacterium]|nr:VWA domain-containing protein [Methylococcaceae bacterium]